MIAEQRRAFGQPFRDGDREELLAFGAVDAKADDLSVSIVKADAIAVIEVAFRVDQEIVGADFRDLAKRFADEAGGIKGADVILPVVGKIVRVAAVVGFFRLRREGVGAVAGGGAVEFRMPGQHFVEQGAVMRRDVLDVGKVFVAAFNLEGADPGLSQRQHVVALVVVLHRQQMLIFSDGLALVVHQRVGQPASLRAFAAIGAAPGVGVADEALAAEGDAERTVDEIFERDIGLRCNLRHFLHRQFAGQHHLRETGIFEKFHLGRIAIVGLRTGVQLDRRQIHFEQAHVLNDQRIGA